MSKSGKSLQRSARIDPWRCELPTAFTGVGGIPLFIEKRDGAYLYDVDGKAYIDYVGSQLTALGQPSGDPQCRD